MLPVSCFAMRSAGVILVTLQDGHDTGDFWMGHHCWVIEASQELAVFAGVRG